MVIVSVNQARQNLADLINTVAQGRPVAISRRGKPVVQLSPLPAEPRPRLPDLAQFRQSLRKLHAPATTIRHLRKLDRY